jgi:hypothetical protein
MWRWRTVPRERLQYMYQNLGGREKHISYIKPRVAHVWYDIRVAAVFLGIYGGGSQPDHWFRWVLQCKRVIRSFYAVQQEPWKDSGSGSVTAAFVATAANRSKCVNVNVLATCCSALDSCRFAARQHCTKGCTYTWKHHPVPQALFSASSGSSQCNQESH